MRVTSCTIVLKTKLNNILASMLYAATGATQITAIIFDRLATFFMNRAVRYTPAPEKRSRIVQGCWEEIEKWGKLKS